MGRLREVCDDLQSHDEACARLCQAVLTCAILRRSVCHSSARGRRPTTAPERRANFSPFAPEAPCPTLPPGLRARTPRSVSTCRTGKARRSTGFRASISVCVGWSARPGTARAG